MRAKIAKSGTIHIQHSMFSTDERDVDYPPKADHTRHVYTITFASAYEGFLHAYRAGKPPDKAEVVTAGGYAVQVRHAVILDGDNGEQYEWTEIQSAAHRAWQAETADDEPDPREFFQVDYREAYEVMLDALRNEEDPWLAQIRIDPQRTVPVGICALDGAITLTDVLTQAEIDRQYEQTDEREALAQELEFTDDWSM